MPDEPTPTPEPTPDPPAEPAGNGRPGRRQPYDPAGRTRRHGLHRKRCADFESVREKIETRYGTAIGAAELDAETPEGRTVEEQYDARQRAAAERLAQIRESMRKPEDESQ